MLISHRYRFIFLKTSKTAGTSVESYFERFCMPEGEWMQQGPRMERESSEGIVGYRGDLRSPGQSKKWFNHMPAWLVREQIGEKMWADYFKFCTIRNPFEKAISAFEHFGKDHSVPEGLMGRWFRRKHPRCNAEQLRFLHWVERHLPVDRDKYMIDSEFCLDDVVRYESLVADLQRVCSRLGVPWEPALLPSFKSNERRNDATVANLYTPWAIRRVEETYAFELKEFGYSFPGAGPSP